MATFAMRKGKYKITLYRGYDAYDRQDAFELFDLENDPGEMTDLMEKQRPVADAMRSEVLARFEEINQPPRAP